MGHGPPGPPCCAGPEGSSEPKTISPRLRLNEFPNECLGVYGKEGSKLFCNACREELSLRRNIVSNHVASRKHKCSKEKLASRDRRERDIAKHLEEHDVLTHPVGETLPMEQRVYRLKVVKTFLRAAVPLSKVDAFRDLLEESFRLTDRRHMCDLIPFIITQEKADIKAEIVGRPVSVVFDGTTHARLGEAMAIVIRFVDNSFAITQCLIRLQLLTKSMTGEEIARELINTLCRTWHKLSHILGCMHDRAACNGIAMRTLKIVFPALVDVRCFSHTLDLVGDKFCTPVLSSFINWWISLFSHSPSQCCCGRRELVNHIEVTLPRGGGVSSR